MAALSKDELLRLARAQVLELSPEDVRARLQAAAPPLVIDVRETDEIAGGNLPSAKHVPRGFLELRIEGLEPSRDAEIILYCQTGTRSLLAARALLELGYSRATSMQGGFSAWKDHGHPWVVERRLSQEQRVRYARHLTLSEVGEDGQRRLLDGRVLLIGAGGLGSPAALYLAAAGVGTVGVVDPDVVDRSNLQRQILHRDTDVGVAKVESAERAMQALNPDIRVIKIGERFSSENALEILDLGWDAVVDGTDNFPTRYLVNDACVLRGVPNVHGSVYRFEGQVAVFAPSLGGPCYRCLYPEPPPPGASPNCAEAGVIGALPGIIGTFQAIETMKLILRRGRSLVGRLLQYDALEQSFTELRLRRNPKCPACGESPTIRGLSEVEFSCALPS